MKTVSALATIAALTITALAASGAASAHPLDRVEDRIDRREDVRDRAVTYGPWDRVEDRVDSLENRYDRRHAYVPQYPYGHGAVALDRAEDRWDRREDYRDAQVTWGRLDLIEDRLDRAENRIDRRTGPYAPAR